MKELNNIEFYATPAGQVMIAEAGKPVRQYDMHNDFSFTGEMIAMISAYYPKAYEALAKIYEASAANVTYYEYLIVSRFIRCNFSAYDNRADLNNMGKCNFEFVSCPLRGECKYCNIICAPEFNSNLSDRELQVMKLYCDGYKADEIADKLFISIQTVLQHKRNSLTKLSLHSLSDFIIYAKSNKIFKDNDESDRA